MSPLAPEAAIAPWLKVSEHKLSDDYWREEQSQNGAGKVAQMVQTDSAEC